MHVLNTDFSSTTQRKAHGVQVSSLFFWLFMVVGVILMLDPTNPGYSLATGNLRLARDTGPIKYIGVFIGWISLVFCMTGLALNRPRVAADVRKAFARSWPITLYALIMLGGALYARFVVGDKDTFLQGAVGVTAYFVGLAY